MQKQPTIIFLLTNYYKDDSDIAYFKTTDVALSEKIMKAYKESTYLWVSKDKGDYEKESQQFIQSFSKEHPSYIKYAQRFQSDNEKKLASLISLKSKEIAQGSITIESLKKEIESKYLIFAPKEYAERYITSFVSSEKPTSLGLLLQEQEIKFLPKIFDSIDSSRIVTLSISKDQ